MKKRIRELGLLATLLVAGAAASFACGGSDPNAAEQTGQAKQLFVSKVYDSLSTTCLECHGTGKAGAPIFLGQNADISYTAIDGFPGLISLPSASPIIQKGVHSGPALTSTQSDLVTQWLTLEAKERNLGVDDGIPKNLRAAFKAFGDCMDYDRWMELKLYTIAATDTDDNRGQCRSCHNTGMASMWLSGGTTQASDQLGNAETFLMLRQFPYVQRLVVGSVNAQGEFDTIQGSRRILDKGTEAQQPQSNSHPRFSLTTELSTNLETFVLETISNVAANRCPQPANLPDAGPDVDAALFTQP